ncbi:hypothetical protein [Alteraurantiacibacter palmitatis]|uniref:Uncharacterized protein n=1 Tax=Alteraurantiacibacter palmitatis TaxID=2054628 RepID=A0ABV7E733_9SPHN
MNILHLLGGIAAGAAIGYFGGMALGGPTWAMVLAILLPAGVVIVSGGSTDAGSPWSGD